ncbi:MAG: hypothetical protein OSA78_04280 [Flavobacteriales bacterium]|nr:hypothetical protein [Flavobacteriales bacterium]
MQRFPASVIFLCLALSGSVSIGTSQNSVPVDSIQIAAEDSLRLHQKEVQALLQEEFHEMTRFPLGSRIESWSHVLDMEVTRGNISRVQRFWFTPKENRAMIWLPDSSRSNECLFFDPETDRLASIFPSNSNGTLIPKAMAVKMGLNGNATETVSKRQSNWKTQPSDSLLTVSLSDGETTIEVVLGEKSSWQALGVTAWLSMQPVPGFSLPPQASKQPIVSFEQTNKDGIVLYQFRVVNIEQLEIPFTLDLSSIRVDDPTRPLMVIAKEWAEQNKANQQKETQDQSED